MRKIIVIGIMFILLSNIFVIFRETSSFDYNIEESTIELSACFDEEQNHFTSDAMNVELRWMIEFDYICESLEVFDYNYDGYMDIITAQEGNYYQRSLEMHCIFGDDGSFLWNKSLPQNIMSKSMCVADIDNDGIQDILGEFQMVYCYDIFGTLKWSDEPLNNYDSRIAIIDPNNDGLFDIFVRNGQYLKKMDYSGKVVWIKEMVQNIAGDIAIADIDGVGGYNIIFPVLNGYLYCLDSHGNEVWNKSYSTDENFRLSTPTIADVDVTAGYEILTAGDDDLYCLDCYGNILWTKNDVHDGNDFSILVADINNDNKLEILTYRHDDIYCFDNLGNYLWEYAIDYNMYTEPLIADLNGDGFCEILTFPNSFYSIDPHIVCFDYQGNLVWTYDCPKGEIKNACVTDVDLNGILEIIFINTKRDAAGKEGPSTIYCLNLTGVTSSGIQPWSSDRGSTFNTGCADRDGDSIDDFTEDNWESNINSYDSDSDTMHDGIEFIAGLNPMVNDLNSDLDGDGLTNQEELYVYHTNVRNPDADGDSINDYNEIIVYGTNPNDEDTDHDGLNDYDEIFVHSTNATNFDSEGDLLPDGWEIQYGFDPWLNDSYLDQDNDTLTAYEEYLAGGSPFNNDTDADGLPDADEYRIYGTDAGNENTDEDMMGDFWEVTYGTDPLVDDSYGDPDADFLVNFEEYQLGTDPLNRDTDGDGFGDGDEINKGYDPLDPDNHPPIPPSPSVKLGVSFVSGIFLAFFTLLMFIGILSKRKL